MFSQLLQHSLNGLHVVLTFAFGVDEDVIEIHYHENVKLLCQDLVDIALKCGRCIGQSKKYYLVLEITVAGLEGHFPFIAFFDPHSMIGIGQVKLSETLSLVYSIQ